VAKSPTVYDVAQAAGVSIATVSFTFSKPDRVKKATRDAVLAAAAALGYVPSASARGLAAGRTQSFGLIFWDSADAAPDDVGADLRFFPRWGHEVQYGIERAAWHRGYAIMVGDGNAADIDATAIDIAGRVDGLVLLPRMLGPETLVRIAERIPVVSVTEGADHPHVNSVTVDNEQGMRDLTRHLVEVHHIRSATFVGKCDTPDHRARFDTLRDTLQQAGLPAPLPLGEGDPDALVCRTDSEALDLLEDLRHRGIRVPEDVIVTGFDGIAAGLVSQPTLTTVRQPMHDLGAAAVQLLLNRLADPQSAIEHHRYPVQLTVRHSCGC
jgi:LacI family transcriptional regulator, galactose operon repressor